MDSVVGLMRKVECEEKAAEQAKEEADWSSFDIVVKVNERKQAIIEAQKTKDMLVRKVNVQKAVLATKMDVVQSRMQHLLDDGDRCLEVLDEMTKSLEMRLTSVLLKKELAIKKKQENEAFSQVVLAYDFKMEKIVEESKRWKQEALEVSKLLEFLKDRGHVVDMLYGEISDECQDVNRLKEELDQAIPLGGLLSSNRKLSSLAASSSSLKSSKPDVVKNVVLEADIKIPDMVDVIITEGQAMSIECNDLEGNPGDVVTREKNKLCGNQMFAKNGSVFSPELLDLTADEYLIEKFALAGVSMVTSLALAIHYPTIAAAPRMLINGYKNALAIAVETKYSFPLADKVKRYLADPSKFAMAAPVDPAAAGAPVAAPAEEKKEEATKESDDDMGFSLFD